MKTSRVFILLLAFSVSLSLAGQDQSNSAVESRIVAMEKAWNQAFKARDTRAIDALLHDSVVLVNDDGSLQSKAAFLNWIRNSKPTEDEQVTPESLTVNVHGNVAVATGTFRTTGIESGKPYSRRDRFVDTWKNEDGSWLCISASATPMLR